MTEKSPRTTANGSAFDVQAEAQKQKMNAAARKHGYRLHGDGEPNAGGVNRETGDRKARQNDRETNGGE
jgi:hypothetical protein